MRPIIPLEADTALGQALKQASGLGVMIANRIGGEMRLAEADNETINAAIRAAMIVTEADLIRLGCPPVLLTLCRREIIEAALITIAKFKTAPSVSGRA